MSTWPFRPCLYAFFKKCISDFHYMFTQKMCPYPSRQLSGGKKNPTHKFFLIYCLLPAAGHCPLSQYSFCITEQGKQVTAKPFPVPTMSQCELALTEAWLNVAGSKTAAKMPKTHCCKGHWAAWIYKTVLNVCQKFLHLHSSRCVIFL